MFSDKVIVIASELASTLGVLSSTIHSAWFEKTRTGRGAGSSYVVSRCLRTFAFPNLIDVAIEETANEFEDIRNQALESYISVTKLYNSLDNPEVNSKSIVRLREAQVSLDDAVINSYGWNDLQLSYGFFELAGVTRFTCSPDQRNEIRKRLLKENTDQFNTDLRQRGNNQVSEIADQGTPEGALF